AADSIGVVTNEYESVLVSHTAQLGGSMLNEALFQYTTFNNAILPVSNDPFIYYPSGFHTGESNLTPQSTHQKKYQYKDDFSFSADLWNRRNDFKLGLNYIDEPELGGDFTTGTAGQYTAAEDFIGSPITLIQIYGGVFVFETPIEQYNVYVQDDIQFNDRLTLNVGLRYDYWDGYELDQRSNPIYPTLRDQRAHDQAFFRDFWGYDGVNDNDDDNFAPRLGFTYDLKGDGTMLLRGGYGTFYDFPYTNATLLFPAAAVQAAYGEIYRFEDPNGIRNPDGSFFQPGQTLPPSQQPPSLSGPDEILSPEVATPYSDQISLGLSWQPNEWLGLNFEAVSIDYHDIPYRTRPNIGVDANHDGVFDPSAGEERIFPEHGLFRLFHGNGRGSYDGVNVGFRVRKEKWEMQGFYTWSEAESNVIGGVDEFRLTGGDFQPGTGGSRARRDQSINPSDPTCGACFGPVYRDAEHKITIGGTYRAPWEIVIAGMARYHSAFPFTRFAGADLNGDGAANDLAPGVSSVNSERASDFTQIDLRFSRDFRFGPEGMGVELIAEIFNVLDDENPAGFFEDGTPTVFSGDPAQGEQRLWQFGARFHF
ncbi:MAG: TonB-dependent receptor domain-containing protein, partial [Candidatus Binatia bacterium]